MTGLIHLWNDSFICDMTHSSPFIHTASNHTVTHCHSHAYSPSFIHTHPYVTWLQSAHSIQSSTQSHSPAYLLQSCILNPHTHAYSIRIDTIEGYYWVRLLSIEYAWLWVLNSIDNTVSPHSLAYSILTVMHTQFVSILSWVRMTVWVWVLITHDCMSVSTEYAWLYESSYYSHSCIRDTQ